VDRNSELLLSILGVIALGGFVARGLLASSRRGAQATFEKTIAGLQERLREQQRLLEDLRERSHRAEDLARRLQRSIVVIPEVAQRLSGATRLREIPERALEFVEEIFEPDYAVFYASSRGKLVAVAARGACEFELGHRLDLGDGIVGWTAVKQIALTRDDAESESGLVKANHLSRCLPKRGFALSLPIVNGERTLGVILIGPLRRDVPNAREIGRTIALVTAVSIAGASVLKQQQTLAQTDGLTGLLNKRHVLSHVRTLMARGEGAVAEGALFLFDIDHFKRYNDTHGHLPGDELLKAMSALLREHVREGEVLARYGGEEFLLVMPGVPKTQALHAAERFRELIAAHSFALGETQALTRVTVSGGVASWPTDGTDLESVLRCADEALYQAKRSGRNRVVAYAAPGRALGGLSPIDPEPDAKPLPEV
jgi:diguanylate cyclase (GGDEF)-like protein